MIRLNLGCGGKKLPAGDGWINVDSEKAANPDMLLDIGALDWPWEAESIDEINASHVLEHLDSDCFLFAMCEAYRVLRPGGHLTIEVPHPRCDFFIGDPTHRTPIDGNVLSLFSQKLNRQGIERGLSNTPLGIYLEIDFDIIHSEIHLNPKWLPALTEADGTTIRNKPYFDHAIETFNNVIHSLKFVLERQ